jgi:transposase
MEGIYVGVDVSKDRLDVHVLPEGQAFAVARDGKGLDELVERLMALCPERIAVEATGGFERVVAAALVGAAFRWWWSTPLRCATSPRRSASAPRPTRSTRS